MRVDSSDLTGVARFVAETTDDARAVAGASAAARGALVGAVIGARVAIPEPIGSMLGAVLGFCVGAAKAHGARAKRKRRA